MILVLLDPIINTGWGIIQETKKKNKIKWEQDLLYKKQKREKQGKRHNTKEPVMY